MQTVWSDAGSFLRELEALRRDKEYKSGELLAARCFIQLFDEIQSLMRKSARTTDRNNP